MKLTQEQVRQIMLDTQKQFTETAAVTGRIRIQGGCLGCFDSIEEAIQAAKVSQQQLAALSLQKRSEILQAMRKTALDNARQLAAMAHEETGFGNVDHKTLKNILAAQKTPGLEDLVSSSYTGDYGLTLVEGAPYGVIGAMTPSTNPAATVINNGISMIAAGNSVVFNAHPSAKKVTLEAIRLLNEAIVSSGGPADLLCAVREPDMETGRVIMEHRDIRILVVTGGEAVVNVAMKSGKKVIAAGPGNPPVIVDDTADIARAAADIVNGASFDNNVLCIAEKEVFVLRKVFDRLIGEMLENGCYKAKQEEIDRIAQTVLENNGEGKYVPNKKYVGRNAGYILEQCGICTSQNCRLIIAEVDREHPFVMTEMLMPVLAVVAVDSLEEAVDAAVKAENNCRHTAIMHSQNVSNLTLAARALNTTIFVKNAPSYAGLGFEGEGYTTLTIATPTGEGLTSARSFTRQRRCTLSGSFRII